MSKMHYFSNKFSKIAKHQGFSALSFLSSSILVTWSCMIWPNCGLSNWLWVNWTLKNRSYDVILVAPSLSRLTEKRHQTITSRDFSILCLSQSKFLAIRQW